MDAKLLSLNFGCYGEEEKEEKKFILDGLRSTNQKDALKSLPKVILSQSISSNLLNERSQDHFDRIVLPREYQKDD